MNYTKTFIILSFSCLKEHYLCIGKQFRYQLTWSMRSTIKIIWYLSLSLVFAVTYIIKQVLSLCYWNCLKFNYRLFYIVKFKYWYLLSKIWRLLFISLIKVSIFQVFTLTKTFGGNTGSLASCVKSVFK